MVGSTQLNQLANEEETVREDSGRFRKRRQHSLPPPPSPKPSKKEFDDSNRRLVVKRRCTDVGCLVFFLVAIVCWLSLGGYVIFYSNLHAVFRPSDSYDNVCGMGNFSDRPYVYYFNGFQCAVDVEVTIISGCATPRFCVEQCPHVTFEIKPKIARVRLGKRQLESSLPVDENGTIYLNETDTGLVAWFRELNASEPIICDYTVRPTLSNIIKLINENKCTGIYLRSSPFLGRCMPSMIQVSGRSLLDDINGRPLASVDELYRTSKAVQYDNDFVANILYDIFRTWQYIVVLLFLAFFLSLLIVITVRCYCKFILWIAIIGIVFIFGGIFILSMLQYYQVTDLLHRNDTTIIDSHNDSASNIEVKLVNISDANSLLVNQAWSRKGARVLNSDAFWLVVSIVSGVVFFGLLLILVGLSSRVKASIDLLIEASKATTKVPLALAFPALPFAMKLIVYGLSLLFMVIFFDARYNRYRLPNMHPCSPFEPGNNGTCIQRTFMSSSNVMMAQLFNFFMLLWLGEWIYGFEYVTLAESYSNYYWTIDKSRISRCHLFYSITVAMFMHPGSIAFGAFILASIQFVYYILQYIYNKIHRTDSQQQPAAVVTPFVPGVPLVTGLLTDVRGCNWGACCLKLLEIVIRFINNNVYIIIAITGESYCNAAASAFQLLLANPLRTLVLTGVADFFFCLLRLSISIVVGAVAFMMFDNRFAPYIFFGDLYAVWFLVLLVAILSYFITNICISVYRVAVETLFVCSLIDYRDNDGSQDKPGFGAAG